MEIKINNKHTIYALFVSTIAVVFRLWLAAGFPKLLRYLPHDDLFFARAANFMIHGEWMGAYDHMTLIKTPFYSIFLVLSFISGLPLLLNETLFYIGACILLVVAFFPVAKSHWLRLAFFVFILFAPLTLNTLSNVIVYRDFVYYSLNLYVVAFSVGLLLRLYYDVAKIIPWSVGLGLSMGAFLITREEGIWIYPTLLLFLVGCLYFIFKDKLGKKAVRILIVLLPIVLWQIPGFIVSYLNFTYYGYWGVSEQLNPQMNRVLSTLGRIQTNEQRHPAIQIPQEARMQAYEVSPMMNEMKAAIESAIPLWNVHDDKAMQQKPDWYLSRYGDGGGEISNGHFSWLLRNVVYQNGYYSDGQYPSEFYKELADQLEEACLDGRLSCSPARAVPFVGAVDSRHFYIMAREFYENLIHLLKQDQLQFISLDFPNRSPLPDDGERIFNQFIYNGVEYPVEQRGGGSRQYLVDGELDARIRMIQVRESLMRRISLIYQFVTGYFFVAMFLAWVMILVPSTVKQRNGFQLKHFLISLLILGLLVSRLATLSILSATSSIPVYSYSGSVNNFVYLFPWLMLNYLVERRRQ